jgi:hypothetical protein
VAPECNKLVMISPDKELLSGTDDGYHSGACQQAHTQGAEMQDLTLQQLPGSEQLQEAVGEISQGGPNGVNPEEAPAG